MYAEKHILRRTIQIFIQPFITSQNTSLNNTNLIL